LSIKEGLLMTDEVVMGERVVDRRGVIDEG